MHMREIMNKRTAIGVGVSVCIMVLSLLLCAFVLVRGVLPQQFAPAWLYVSYGFAALLGGRVAVKQGSGYFALLPSLCLYLLAWILALTCKGDIQFFPLGPGITIAVLLGGVLAYLLSGKKRRRTTQRRKHPVAPVRRR